MKDTDRPHILLSSILIALPMDMENTIPIIMRVDGEIMKEMIRGEEIICERPSKIYAGASHRLKEQ
jgi:hypothetical protein